jgi:Fic family protein
MQPSRPPYLWQQPDWPAMRYDLAVLAQPVAALGQAHGRLLGRLVDVGLAERDATTLAALTDDVVRTSEIEGERLDVSSVRSSLARRLGIDVGALGPVDRRVEGIVEMVLDATGRADAPLMRERLFGWHAALFPTGFSGLSTIRVGAWRDDAAGPMQVVSGPIHRRRIHFEAPPAGRLDAEIDTFLAWFEAATPEPPALKAGLAHLWFVTLHPFDDGSGRIARAVSDLLLSRADTDAPRVYSLSAQIQRERDVYYEILERTQKGPMDVTPWLAWFVASLHRAIDGAHDTVDLVLRKARFWSHWRGVPFNARQLKVLGRVLDGFEGPLTNRKWAAIAKCSPDTALRDLNELVAIGVLQRTEGGGRSAGYEVNA